MIQEFLQTKLRDETERRKLYDIATDCGNGVTVSALSRLVRKGIASIKTCEALFEYFAEQASTRFNNYATTKGVEKTLANDDSLSPLERKLLLAHFKYGHKFITDDMILVFVWFGVCERCEAVYWARSGPPFTRIRSRVTA